MTQPYYGFANDNHHGAAHNEALRTAAAQRHTDRRSAGLARAKAHNLALVVAKHQRIYGGYQIPMFG